MSSLIYKPDQHPLEPYQYTKSEVTLYDTTYTDKPAEITFYLSGVAIFKQLITYYTSGASAGLFKDIELVELI